MKKNFTKSNMDGFLIAGTSPKAWIFFPLKLPQFLDFKLYYEF